MKGTAQRLVQPVTAQVRSDKSFLGDCKNVLMLVYDRKEMENLFLLRLSNSLIVTIKIT